MEKLEKRCVTGVQIEKREEDKGKIKGMAARVGVTYDLGWFEERIEPGAFDDALGDDIRVLFNHNENYVLGRTKSGTATVSTDPEGNLMYEYNTPKNRGYAKDVEDMISSGDIDTSSFAFVIEEDEWQNRGDGEKELRVIKKIKRLYDVSPVTYPANPDTSVAKRTYEDARKEGERRNKSISIDEFKALIEEGELSQEELSSKTVTVGDSDIPGKDLMESFDEFSKEQEENQDKQEQSEQSDEVRVQHDRMRRKLTLYQFS